MTAPKLSLGLALLLAGCDEIPQLEQRRREVEKKSTSVQAEIEAINAHIQTVRESIAKTIAGTTLATISSAYGLVLKDTEGQVAELSKRVDAAEKKRAAVRRDIDDYQQKSRNP